MPPNDDQQSSGNNDQIGEQEKESAEDTSDSDEDSTVYIERDKIPLTVLNAMNLRIHTGSSSVTVFGDADVETEHYIQHGVMANKKYVVIGDYSASYSEGCFQFYRTNYTNFTMGNQYLNHMLGTLIRASATYQNQIFGLTVQTRIKVVNIGVIRASATWSNITTSTPVVYSWVKNADTYEGNQHISKYSAISEIAETKKILPTTSYIEEYTTHNKKWQAYRLRAVVDPSGAKKYFVY